MERRNREDGLVKREQGFARWSLEGSHFRPLVYDYFDCALQDDNYVQAPAADGPCLTAKVADPRSQNRDLGHPA